MVARITKNRRTAIANALHSSAIRLLRGVRKEDEHAGIGPARLSALSVLVFGGAMRLTDLARIEQVKAPTMTKIVAGLEADGLVRRRADAEDARAVRLVATPRGTKLLHEARRRRVARLAAALARLGKDEILLLGRAVEIIEKVSTTI